MTKIHCYYKENILKMWSEDEISAPALKHIILDVSDDDFAKLKNGWTAKIKNNSLVLEQHPRVIRITAIDNLKKQLEEPQTLPQLKNSLKEILNLIEN